MEILQKIIEAAWENVVRGDTNFSSDTKKAVTTVLDQLDAGALRVAQCLNGQWTVNQCVKQAILLSFRIYDNKVIQAADYCVGYDKVPLKCANWSTNDFVAAGFRMVPGTVARKSAYIGKNVILMPSFINVGAYIDAGTMIDTWATVGSCAQIGKNCHISGGVGIGGVLEPLQANPVIIEDNVFIGARSEVVEGVIVEQGAVLGMGVYIGASTRIYDRETGETIYGRVPAYSVVVSGTLPCSQGKANTYAAIIVKKVDAQTRSKTSLNELLRESSNA